MPKLSGKVTTGDGLLKELYEVSAEYQATVQRLAAAGTNEAVITSSLYRSSLRAYTDTVFDNVNFEALSREAKRAILINLATISLRWAKTLRSE